MSEVSEECRICGSAGPHRSYLVREMYFGTRETFTYFICAECETLQIVDILEGEALARHYPRKYYSYNISPQPRFLRWLTMQRDQFDLHINRRLVGTFIATSLPPGIRSLIGTRDSAGDVVRMLGQIALPQNARILDVGCGSGGLLDRLARVGFTNLAGADPFIEADFETPLGVRVVRRTIDEVTGEFDLIMFNHSLEHVPDAVGTLKAARERLAPQGICLVRLPTTSSEAWTIYGPNWCLIDAPRHTVIPSRQAMALLADSAGLRLGLAVDDSNSSQFFGSECYRRDISLPEITSLWHLIRLFGLKQLWVWERRSERLNKQARGDQAGFFLRVK